jgi:hypothetical protein
MSIVFDQGTPAPLRRALSGHIVATAFELGWSYFGGVRRRPAPALRLLSSALIAGQFRATARLPGLGASRGRSRTIVSSHLGLSYQ